MIRWLALCLIAAAMAIQSRAARPCAESLAQCPPRGCAARGTPEAVANGVRRTVSHAAPRVTLSVDDFERLQAAADRRFRQGFAIPGEQRTALQRIVRHRGITIGEGHIVRVRGYIVGTPYLRPSDSANCNLAGTANHNIRFHVAADATDTMHESIIAEIIPTYRQHGWNLTKLRKLQHDQHLVMITGQLFYDSRRLVNDSPEARLAGHPPRRSLWELHPVTAVQVCVASRSDCRPDDPHAWQPLAAYSK